MTDVSAPASHAAGVKLYAAGEPRAAFAVLARTLADALHPELLNDLAVTAIDARGVADAAAILRTATLVDDRPEVADNGRALAHRRAHGFAAALLAEVLRGALGGELAGNVDTIRYPAGERPWDPPLSAVPVQLAALLHDPDHEWLYDVLADDTSRELMVALLAYRLLGYRRVRLPLGGGRHEAALQRARELVVEEGLSDLGFLGWQTDRFDLSPLGCPVEVEAHVVNIEHGFVLEQYRCPGHPEAAVRPGDVVVDGGGCWGETALWFAHQAGEAGRVVTYEFEPANLARLRANLERNPDYARRITVEERALWDRSDESLSFASNGPGTVVGTGTGANGGGGVLTRAIDDLDVPRVDFLKLDVEGAELRALRGAEGVIRRDRPRLAVAIYHRPQDWTEIPRWLDALELGYRFALGHFTMHGEETILFAWAD